MEQKQARRIGVYAGVLFVAAIVLTSITMYVTTEDDKITIHFDLSNLQAAEADPGAGASGFLEVYIVPIAANVRSENNTGTIEAATMAGGTAFASADSFSIDVASETAFMILVRARWNKTHAFDSVNNEWGGNKTSRCKITCSGDITIANVTGTLMPTQNSSSNNYFWANIYWDNGGSGYQISDSGTITISEICVEGKYS